MIFSLIGGLIILLSFYIKAERQYNLRWLFSIGILFSFMAIGGLSTYNKQQKLNYTLNDSVQTYVGYITNTPQDKPRSVAYKIHLKPENIDVVCYLQRDSIQERLEVGDEIIFIAKLQAFKNAGNPDDFDYKQYMYNQGFVASSYLSSSSWLATGKTHQSLLVVALKFRQKIMDFYSSLGFTDDEHAILSALTLGYQDSLSDDLKQGFRTTGTVHVLSVSGLHVGIIFGVMSFILSFIRRTSRFYRIKPIVIIILLWIYSFITGLPASVVRASTMLTVFCLADVFNRKSSSLNNLFIAAFFMLLYNPFQLFDIGFQLSCISVLSILVLHPRLTRISSFSNKYVRGVWSLLALSLVAQLATFPLCLYYFGTFPTYFFLANLVIVPLVSFITYGVGFVFLGWMMSLCFPIHNDVILWLPIKLVQLLVEIMIKFVNLFESLPFSLIEHVEVSFIQLLLLSFVIITLLIAGIKNSSKSLISSLIIISVIIGMNIYIKFQDNNDKLIIFNRNGYSEITYYNKSQEYRLDSLFSASTNDVIEINGYKILFANSVLRGEGMIVDSLYSVDYAILAGCDNLSLSSLDRFYNIDTLILDGSLNSYVRRQLTKECENRNIPFHDVTENGAFSINF